MRRFHRFLLFVFFGVALILGGVIPAWANSVQNWWEDPNAHQPPSCYAGRIYTRQHWVDFYVNESQVGANWNTPGSRLLFSGYCSVFDRSPQDLTHGYTAVGDNDGAAWSAAAILDSLGVPNVDGYWIISPAYWQTQGSQAGAVSPFTGSGEMINDVPLTGIPNDSNGLRPYNTINAGNDNPACFANGPEGGFHAGAYYVRKYWSDRAGGYVTDKIPYHWYSIGSKSPVGLTSACAANFGHVVVNAPGHSATTTRAVICYSYIYGLTATQLTPVGNPVDGKQTWKFTVYNTTPFIAKNVKLRAYLVQNGSYTLAANTTTDIGPIPIGNTGGGVQQPTTTWSLGQGVEQSSALFNTVTWTFETPVPSGQHKLLATANLEFSSGRGVPEPLNTVVAYGHNVNTISGLVGSGRMEAANSFIPPGNTVDAIIGGSMAYIDNFLLSGQQSGWQPPGGGGEPDNLVAKNVTCDPNTGRTEATFSNTFKVGGTVTIRFYFQPEGGGISLVDQKTMWVAAGSDFTASAYIPDADSKSGTVLATVDYRLSGSTWVPEKYRGDDGKDYDEAKYEDNKASCSVGHQPYQIKEPGDHPAYYHPVREVSKYETITEPVYGWKKVKFHRDKISKDPAVRLVE